MMKQINCSSQIFVLLIFISDIVNAQTYKDSVRNQFQVYTDLIAKKEFKESLRFVNPEFLKVFPGTQLVAAMERIMNNPEIEIKIEGVEILSVSDTQKFQQKYYVQLRYLTGMAMRMSEDRDTASIKAGLAGQFGKENVRYDHTTKYYHLTMRKNVVADSKDAKRWTFVAIEERQRAILQKFIPEEVLNFSE